jgi:hypothetical protein
MAIVARDRGIARTGGQQHDGNGTEGGCPRGADGDGGDGGRCAQGMLRPAMPEVGNLGHERRLRQPRARRV